MEVTDRHSVIIKCGSGLQPQNGIRIYTLIIRPITTYAAPAWAHCSQCDIHKLLVVQNKCLRQAVNAPRYIPIKYLHSELKQELLQDVFYQMAEQFYDWCLITALGDNDPEENPTKIASSV
ncbi:hypothetical protein PR048_008114 [Dryococelus australis]|uniref:Uncharacterized protein n=1 Tax=Dryococelus australis TaxID=614101 RepID=A0ABQ9HWH7_9NEOP|nr:hypothetical protein PR048_008114 [Dryococelus australis]